ncbi:MAG: AAA family ATPase [Candidatus Aminicenantes bacterium]|nr:MAG: AAA family ATPase [Candidatus Aminicenantes bacterium]
MEDKSSKVKSESSGSVKKDVNVLVIGDWIVDEDWVMTYERSETSAKQHKEKHFHTAYDDPDLGIKRLCGASLTASAVRGFLESETKEKEKKEGTQEKVSIYGDFKIYGIGVWDPDDDNFMEELFKENNLVGANPFHIHREAAPIDEGEKRLFNLAREGDICSTTRVVRTFLGHPGSHIAPMSRYDWHLQWKPEKMKEKSLKEIIDERMEKIFKQIGNVEFDAIVLADFNKGLITEELVLSLTQKIQVPKSKEGILWFYRTKQIETPDWYYHFSKQIRTGDSFIRFIDPRLSKKYAKGKSLTYGTELTADGLNFLKKYKTAHIDNSKLAVLFQDNSCIAYDNNKKQIWVLRSTEKPTYITRGRSSIFLASLVIMELERKKKCLKPTQEDNFGTDCQVGLSNGIKWCNACMSIWQTDKKIKAVAADISKAVGSTKPDSNISIKLSGPKLCSVVENEWSQAQSKDSAGCIQITGKNNEKKYQLEVWRAHTCLDDFTILDPDRKENILNLTSTIQGFMDTEDKEKQRPLISLVLADPGSGKSYLAKCLAKKFELELFECNISQLTSLDGLTNFFDQVDIAQREGRKIFMFLDEVDTLINGESIFGFLLELMWCGRYYRNGLKNALKPFPGFFAMSRDPDEQQFKIDHPKFRDLKSRIFGIYCHLANISDVEAIYLFARLLNRYFGEIAQVELGVLKTIGNTKFKYGARSIELFISLLKGVKRDKITKENLPPKSRIDNMVEHFPKGMATIDPYGEEERRMVEINYTPPD